MTDHEDDHKAEAGREHEHHVTADTQRDAVALSKALVLGDAEALNAVLVNTECAQCLCVAAMQWGLSIAAWAGGDTSATEGHPVGTPQFRAEVAQVIARAQRQLAGMSET